MFLTSQLPMEPSGTRIFSWNCQEHFLPGQQKPPLLCLRQNRSARSKLIYIDGIWLATTASNWLIGAGADWRHFKTRRALQSLTFKTKPRKKLCFSVLHLYNTKAAKEPNIQLTELTLKHTLNPACQGVTLDRTLSLEGSYQERQNPETIFSAYCIRVLCLSLV